jgi:phosphoglycerol transferase
MFSVPIAIVLNFKYSIKKPGATDDYQQHVQLFLISFLIPLLIITALFTAHVTGSSPSEIAGRIHMRYYNFVSPLLFIIAAGGIYQHQQLNIKNKKQWIIVSILLIISIYTIFFEKKNMLPYLADCPQWLGFVMNKTFFYVLSTLGILSLITYGINKKLGSKFYIYIFMPLFIFVSLYNIHVNLRNNSIATFYDQAGRVTKDFLKNDSIKIIVAGAEAGGLFRTLFHIDNLKANILMLAPEASLDSSLVPPNTDYVVLIGNHPGLDNHPRLDFTDFSIIQMTNGVNIDFRKETFPLVKIEGLSGQEEWGRWSVGDKVKISFMTALPKKFTLIIKANAFGPNIQNDFKVTVGRETKKFRLTPPNDTISLDFNNVDNEKSIIIAIPKATSPKQLGISSDDRLLGIGLIELKVHEK